MKIPARLRGLTNNEANCLESTVRHILLGL